MSIVLHSLINAWGKMQLDLNNPYIQGILIGLIGALLATFTVYVINHMRKSRSLMISLFRNRVGQQSGLETYKRTINDETLRISHPWMKEDQTLNDILVSINFNTEGLAAREELEAYLRRIFQENSSPRILIVGRPGSGKTVVMRMITKVIWTIIPQTELVPIHLTFSDIKGVIDHRELEKRIVRKLES